MKNYRLFYNYKVTGDVLLCLIRPDLEVTKCEEKDNLSLLFHDEEIVGWNLFKVSEFLKIKSDGIIFCPPKELLIVINSFLKRYDAAPLLEEPDSSFYHVYQILNLEEHPLDEKLQIVTLAKNEKETLTTVSGLKGLEKGKFVVALSSGAITYDGEFFVQHLEHKLPIEVLMCSGADLKINDDRVNAFLVEGYEAGSDFFLGGK